MKLPECIAPPGSRILAVKRQSSYLTLLPVTRLIQLFDRLRTER